MLRIAAPLLSVFAVLVLALLLPACGELVLGEDEPPPDTIADVAARPRPRAERPDDDAAPPGADAARAPGAASAVLGRGGGEVALPNGAAIEVPPGALAGPTTVSIEEVPTAAVPGAVGAVYRFTPEGTTFAVPVTVTLPFDPALAPDGEGVQVLTAPREGEAFTSLGGWVVDAGRVRATTTHFSLFVAGSEAFQVLAARETYPTGLATDGRQVFWASGGNPRLLLDEDGGMEVPDGGAPSPEAGRGDWSILMTMRLGDAADAGADAPELALEAGVATPLGPPVLDARQVALDEREVFVTVGGRAADAGSTRAAVVRMSRLGAARATLTSGVRFPTAIALATSDAGVASHVFFSDWDTGRVARVPARGGAVVEVAAAQGRVPYLAVHDGYVYWGSRDHGDVLRRRVDLGEPTETLATGLVEPEGIAVDDAWVYVTTRGAARGAGALVRVPRAGGAAEVLWSGLERPEQLALAGDWVTFADSGARAVLQLHRVTLARRSRALGQAVPVQVVAAAGQIYWATAGDDVLRGGVQRTAAARCTAEECAASGLFCSAATGACTATCPPAPTNPRDVYVSPRVPSGGTGTAVCPLRTATLALATLAASNAGGTKTAYLAQGAYTEASGEVFPLDARGARVIGAGPATTVVEGHGLVDGGPATVVVGDSPRPTTLARLALRPAPGAAHGTGRGARCARGAVRLEGVAIGPGYGAGVQADDGCVLALVASALERNAVGVLALSGADVAVGDGSEAGRNFFARSWTPTITGVAVDVRAGARAVTVRRNTFRDDDVGVSLTAEPGAATPTRIENNLFERQYVAGVRLRRAAVVDAFVGNTIRDVRYPAWLTGAGAGLILDAADAPSPHAPRVRRARGNVFVGNDVGVWLRAPRGHVDDPSAPPNDFGTPASPGGNTFRCNAVPDDVDGGTVAGADVLVQGELLGGAPLMLAGNAWDRAAPTVSTLGASAPRGVDVAAPPAYAAALDLTAAAASTRPCPSGRSPGP